MPLKANLAIGIAIFARSIVSCDACLLPGAEAVAGAVRGVSSGDECATAPDQPSVAFWRRTLRGLSQDPARSRAQVKPLPRALYEIFPRGA